MTKLLSSLNELSSSSQLEAFDCGRCIPDDVSPALGFLREDTRVLRMKHFKADMGRLFGQEIDTMTSPGLLEDLNSLRVDHGISVDLMWKRIEPPPITQKSDLYNGLPAAEVWEDLSDWY